MQKKFRLFTPVIIVLIGLSVLLTVTTLFVNRWLFILCGVISAFVFFIVYLMLTRINKKFGQAVGELGNNIYYANHKAFTDSNLPTLAVYGGEEIIWYNASFLQTVLDEKIALGEHVNKIFPFLDVATASDDKGTQLEYNHKKYTVFVTLGNEENKDVSVIYFIDDTQLKTDAFEYHQTRPSVAIILVDSYEELVQDYKDIERAQIMGAIEDSIRKYFGLNNGFIVKLERDRFMAVIEERGVEKIKEDKFELLNQIKSLQLGDKMTTTLSIGLGHNTETLDESEEMAKQALDMCLGRGGDQAAIKGENGYKFYGGVSSGVEKRTKVKTRIIASALAELIEASSNVVIMGHRFADLDALGSGVGLLKAVREMKPSSFICINQEKTLVAQLLDRLKIHGYTDKDFRSPESALKAINNNTLLIVVDVHVPGLLESEAVYRECKNVVVIDHHRKLVDYINNAVIFYHEPFASSTSEMVTELIQYFPKDPKIGKIEAEALLAGITLDTKSFIMRTGVRTFEAAAWLRRMGANTLEVRRLFTSSMENYRNKASMVANAEIYKNCAIAYSERQFEGIRVVSSQAADDLMGISGTNASFVIFPYDNIINISARSMGEINVQVIMESLGGGGHHTMAAAQLKGETVDNIIKTVKKSIDDYYGSLSDERLKVLNMSIADNMHGENVEDGIVFEGQALTDVKAINQD